jgi:hypothetical protein
VVDEPIAIPNQQGLWGCGASTARRDRRILPPQETHNDSKAILQPHTPEIGGVITKVRPVHRIDETGENVRHLGITKQDSIAQAHRTNGLAHLRNRVRPLSALDEGIQIHDSTHVKGTKVAVGENRQLGHLSNIT